MTTIPKELPKAINWVRRRVLVWAGVAAEIGLQPQQVSELGDLAQEANAALAEYRRLEALTAAQGVLYRSLARRMRARASAQVTQVRGFARTTDSPQAVYAKAQLRTPARRGRAAAPGKPTSFTTQLLSTGALVIAFRCPHPKGVEHVTYRVERRVGDGGPFAYLTTTKERRFRDERIPVGAGVIAYRVTAMTSTRDGDTAEHPVRLGTLHRPGAQRPQRDAA